MEIRAATVDDADGMARVHVGTWQVAYKGIVADRYLDALDVADRAERWRSGIAAPDGPIWVALDGEAIVGWASVGPTRDDDGDASIGELYGIYVDPKWWGRNVGPELMRLAVDWLSARFPVATLWTLEANARARRFYEKAGWSPDGVSQPLETLDGVMEVRYRIEF